MGDGMMGSIPRLIANPEENRKRMSKIMEAVKKDYNPPDLTCIPDNAMVITQAGFMHATDFRSVDCRQ